RIESNLLRSLDRFFGQTMGQATNDSDLGNCSANVEDDLQRDNALDLILTGLFSVLGPLAVNDSRPKRGGHRFDATTTAQSHITAASGATTSGVCATALAASNAGVRPGSVGSGNARF